MSSTVLLRLLWRVLYATVPTFLVAIIIVKLITDYWPAARIPGIAVAGVCWVLWAFAGCVYAIRGRHSKETVLLGVTVFFIVIGAVIVAVGEFSGRLWGDARFLLDFAGLYYLAICAVATVKYKFQELQLEADLESPHNTPEDDREKTRKYMHPYI
jgi:hypothetical protein